MRRGIIKELLQNGSAMSDAECWHTARQSAIVYALAAFEVVTAEDCF
jgi:hypothetical protein